MSATAVAALSTTLSTLSNLLHRSRGKIRQRARPGALAVGTLRGDDGKIRQQARPGALAVGSLRSAGGYRLPAGQSVLVSPWTTHRHPAFWPNPLRFDPRRFTGGQASPRYANFPFGGGPRACVGEHFAILEAVTLLAVLLRSRRVTCLERGLEVDPNVTLRPVDAVPATLAAR